MPIDLSGLGLLKLPQPDARDFPIHPELTRAAKPLTNRYWTGGSEVLDQGALPQCVAYSGKGFLMASPVRQGKAAATQEIYDWCQQNDEWDGEDYEGTSVHALMRYLNKNGFVESYEWASTVEELHAHIMLRGPAVVGTSWFIDMFTPDREGYIRPTGANVGGHAWLIRGSNSYRLDPFTGKRGAFRMRNSWGRGWNGTGEAWVSFQDMATLIANDGEIALPIEMKRQQ